MPFSLGPEEKRAYMSTLDAPAPQLDLLAAVAFRAVGAAARLGVFEELGDGERTAGELAAGIGADEHALRLLLDVLVSAGYLTRAGGWYACGPSARKWLRQGVPGSYLPTVSLWQNLLFELWDDLEDTVRAGRPAADFYRWLEDRPGPAAQFQRMLGTLASWLSGEVTELVPVPRRGGSLLDIGGGHARYSIAFCERHPELRARVLDLPAALAAGKEAVETAGLGDRVTLHAHDVLATDLGSGHDVALLFNILHGNQPEENSALLEAVHRAVRPGGVVAVLEQLTDADSITDPDSVADEAMVRAFSLNLFHTQGGRVYDRAGIDELLTGAGFRRPEWSTLCKLPTDHLAVTRKPAGDAP
ncbi:methyltransferase [Amycolatopsis cihanbeyliensis]|uniref:O-methyltransferase n=1 Tax=Amycolatopsis cihanbeyliensis TaxID=1128664 RepID=A0A542DFG6_AMYCI|nr:methyltransferase [Amycolatopsis cihanbeyliensis]TQJ01810.1 O-methyltransferase [Amycolatopsis cihanbeyliensis]